MCKKAIAVLLALLVALGMLGGCRSEEDKLYDEIVSAQRVANAAFEAEAEVDYDAPGYMGPPRPDDENQIVPLANDALSGELVIKSYQQRGSTPALDLLAREFMELHPQVEITTEYDENWSDQITQMERKMKREAFHNRVRVEIASGEADYLLYGASEFLDYAGLSRSGALTDLWEFWHADPDISPAEYFFPVIEAFQINGKLPLIPYGFFFTGVYLNRPILQEQVGDPDKLSAVDANDMGDWYEDARKTRPELQMFFTAQGKDTLFSAELPRYIDLENRTQSFGLPGFASFLARTNSVINDDPELDPENELGRGEVTDFEGALRYQDTGELDDALEYWASNGIPAYKNIVTKGRASFALKVEVAMQGVMEALQHKMEYVAGPFPLTSTDGQLGVTVLSETFAMPSSMQDKELAWEFIKYCLRERENLTFNRFGYTGQDFYLREAMPVNRANFIKMAEKMPEYIADNFSAPGYEQLRYDPVDGKEIEAYMDELLTHDPVNLGKFNIDLQDYLDEFYVSQFTTPEQAAKKIQGRVDIWLNE